MILAIDTATRVTTAALTVGTECVGQFVIEGGNPGDILTSRIDTMFDAASCDRKAITQIVVGVGPGPFTSTRVGIAVARSIGLALGVDVVGVCTHDALAAAFGDDHGFPSELVVATDARRSEIYWAFYRDGVRVQGPTVGRPEIVVDQFPKATWVGNGLDRYPELARAVEQYESQLPAAEWTARIGGAGLEAGSSRASGLALTNHSEAADTNAYVGYQLFEPRPLYLRRPDAVPAVKS